MTGDDKDTRIRELSDKLDAATQEIDAIKKQLVPLMNMQFDQAAGGGDVIYTDQNVMLRPFGVVPPTSQ